MSPVDDGFYLFGQNMASDGTHTFYSDGYGGSGEIFELDSATGAVIARSSRRPARATSTPVSLI